MKKLEDGYNLAQYRARNDKVPILKKLGELEQVIGNIDNMSLKSVMNSSKLASFNFKEPSAPKQIFSYNTLDRQIKRQAD